MNKLPVLFLGHGNPMNVLDVNNRFNRGIADIGQALPKPKAILMISAHWYDDDLQVSSSPNPTMIYDFYGFPEPLYQVDYPAKGDVQLAKMISELLHDDGIIPNPTRGFDHGTWTTLKYLYPNADIPVVQLSIKRHQPMAWHITIAQKLKTLREQGVLIVGSGNIVHNLQAAQFRGGQVYDWASEIQHAINQAILAKDLHALANYHSLPHASMAVPTEEHYLPLIYIMAMAERDDKVMIFNDEIDISSISMTSVAVGQF